MTAGVYAIVNKADGMAYVGSSVNIELRWAGHRSTLVRGVGPSAPMVEVWRAVGPDGFDFIILETVLADDDALEEAERRWFQHYADRLYNTHKFARRARADMVALRWRQKWNGGRLSEYQQRQLESIQQRRAARASAGAGEAGDG